MYRVCIDKNHLCDHRGPRVYLTCGIRVGFVRDKYQRRYNSWDMREVFEMGNAVRQSAIVSKRPQSRLCFRVYPR